LSTFIGRILRGMRGFEITPESVALRQEERWIELPKAEIRVVKFKTACKVIVRLHNGKRYVLNLFPFTNSSAQDRIVAAMRDAARRNEEARAEARSAK